jgi:hypothetical protein
MAPNNTDRAVMDKLWININEIQNKLFVDGGNLEFRPFQSIQWLVVSDVVGDRVFFDNFFPYNEHPNGFMEGGTCFSQKITGGILTRSSDMSIQAWHSRPLTRFQTQDDGYVATGTTWRAQYLGHYKPGAQLWYALAAVDANGDQSEWVYTSPVTVPTSPQAITPTGNVGEARVLTGVVNTGITAPQNVSITTENSGNTPVISWDAVASGHGVVIRRVDYDPAVSTLHQCCDLQSGEGANVAVGDILTVRKAFPPSTSRDEFNVIRNFFTQDTIDVSPINTNQDPATGSVSVSYENQDTVQPTMQVTLASGASATIRRKCLGGVDQEFYSKLLTGRTYEVRIRARLVSGTATLEFDCPNAGINDQAISLTSTMTTFIVPISRTQATDDNGTSPFLFNLAGGASGGVIEFEEIGACETTGGQTWLGLPSRISELFDAGSFAGVRDHDAAKTRPNGPDLLGLTDRYGTLFMNLSIYKGVVSQFWAQIPPCLSDSEYEGLTEYLREPYNPSTDTPESKPWAYRRYAAGQEAPWTDEYDYIGVQFGNEAFNTASRSFWSTPGGVSGSTAGEASALIEDRLASVMQSASSWVSDGKVGFEAGGKTGAGFGDDVINTTQQAQRVHDNAYNGSDFYENVSNETLEYSDGWAHALNQLDETRWRARFSDKDATRKTAQTALGRPLGLGVYEGQQSTPVAPGNGSTAQEQADQQYAWWSKGCQIPIVDNFTMAAVHDYTAWAWFDLSGVGGQYWNAIATDANGGAQAAALQWLKLISRLYLPGRIFEASAVVSIRATVDEGGVTYNNVPQVFGRSIYADEGDKKGLLLRNRRVAGVGMDAPSGDGISSVSVVIPQDVGAVTAYTMGGSVSTSNEVFAKKDNLSISSSALTIPADRRLKMDIDPGDIVLLDFDASA